MADNWLESREQKLNGGQAVYRKDNPSLEMLLHRVAEGGSHLRPGTLSDRVKAAQLAAIARSAGILFPEIEFACDEAEGCVRWSPDALDAEKLGEAVLAMRLKACELGFVAVMDGNSLKIKR